MYFIMDMEFYFDAAGGKRQRLLASLSELGAGQSEHAYGTSGI